MIYLLNVFLHTQIAEDEGKFTLTDMVKDETKKMMVRHPHVFGNVEADTPEQVKINWERIKTEAGRESIFDGIPTAFPALARAFKIQDRAAKVGFDWEKPGRSVAESRRGDSGIRNGDSKSGAEITSRRNSETYSFRS